MDYIFTKGNDIFASPKLIRIPEYRELLASQGKEFFADFIIFMYYVYKTNSTSGNDEDVTYMKDYSLSERIERTCSVHLSDRSPEEFLDNPQCEACISIYQSLELSKLERMYENVKQDIDSYIERLSTVPYKVVRKVSIKTPKNLIEEGFPEYVTVDVEFENTEEKNKAIKSSNELIDYAKKMEASVMDEKKKKGKTSGNKAIKLFEDPESVKEFKFQLFNEELFQKPDDR